MGDLPERRHWPRALRMIDAEELHSCVDGLGQDLRIEHRSLPQGGLAMLPLRDANLGQVFLLGELPMASAHVQVTASDGRSSEGAAQVLDDDAAIALAMAVIDAVVAGDLPGAAAAAAVIAKGHDRWADEQAVRGGLLQSTAVQFNRLEVEDDTDG